MVGCWQILVVLYCGLVCLFMVRFRNKAGFRGCRLLSLFGRKGRRVNRSVEKLVNLQKLSLPNSHRFSAVNRSLLQYEENLSRQRSKDFLGQGNIFLVSWEPRYIDKLNSCGYELLLIRSSYIFFHKFIYWIMIFTLIIQWCSCGISTRQLFCYRCFWMKGWPFCNSCFGMEELCQTAVPFTIFGTEGERNGSWADEAMSPQKALTRKDPIKK